MKERVERGFLKSDVVQVAFNLELRDPCQGPQNLTDSKRKDVDVEDSLTG